MGALLAALCSLASACKGKPQCCLHRRMSYGTSRRKLALFSRANRSQRRRLFCSNCSETKLCAKCNEAGLAFGILEDVHPSQRRTEHDDTCTENDALDNPFNL